ncbi:inositol hexakisphosphate-domain-containing protein [Gongronella butleri]|nr:inositol hexakisphosphate-domain-containing protein [Gongronella butleri]
MSPPIVESSVLSSSPKAHSLYGSPPASPRLSNAKAPAQADVVSKFVPARSRPKRHEKQPSITSLVPSPHVPSSDRFDPKSLLTSVSSIIKSRNGTVLTRNTILKMDHFSSGTNTNLDLHLHGAPNFRQAELDVYGVAQPTVIGLSSILSMLHCHPKQAPQVPCTWFSTREEPLVYLNGCPFVLREYADPLQNINMFWGITSARLERLEERLKADVIKEADAMGGLLLVHQELADGTIVPCYLQADQVQTPREVFQSFQQAGHPLKYFRLPISPDQGPEDNYFDEYVRVIRDLSPTEPLIFNCGMGNVRTTVGIIIAQTIRRTQLLERGHPDPFTIQGYEYAHQADPDPMLPLGSAREQETLLRLVYVLEQALESKMSMHSAIEWALERGNNLDSLKEAIIGNYHSVVSLTSVLENGDFHKRLLDQMMDRSDAVVHLREMILTNRIRYSCQQNSKSYRHQLYLERASKSLQRYFFLICFTAYVNQSEDTRFDTRFSSWIKTRTEVWAMLENMRRKGPRLYYFRPIRELESIGTKLPLSARSSVAHSRYRGGYGMFDMVGARDLDGMVMNEMESLIVQSRRGDVFTAQTLLKVDFWYYHYLNSDNHPCYTVIHANTPPRHLEMLNCNQPQKHHAFFVEGASNFRRIDHTRIYGIAQPTVYGLRQVLRQLLTSQPRNERILWINLREEPIIYLNGIPYVLRDRYYSLRNIRAYKGITGSRLEQLEKRLKHDILQELSTYGGRILLHGENQDGQVFAQWEEMAAQDVMTVREVMEAVALEVAHELELDNDDAHALMSYHRIPMTAEKVPEYEDLDELRALIANVHLGKTALVMNCQIGVGRSTTGTVVATLLTRWIQQQQKQLESLDNQEKDAEEAWGMVSQPNRLNYQIINSLLRVIKRGLENKRVVDDVLDQCGLTINLRDVIEQIRVQAENETDELSRRRKIKRGIVALERYYTLIAFQVYLDTTSPDLLHETISFRQWMKQHLELATILKDLQTSDTLDAIVPVEKDEQALALYEGGKEGDGLALTSEVLQVLQARHGQVLAKQTILKHDVFPGCQKQSLREKIPGAYNFRRIGVDDVRKAAIHSSQAATAGGLAVDMALLQQQWAENGSDDEAAGVTTGLRVPNAPFICGCAMPNKDAIKEVLKAMDAAPGGSRRVLWTCLREEPVLYINKRPYVLRLHHNPLRNLETTGITTDRVEHMERIMQQEALQELKLYHGRLLIHDEETTEKGGFTLVPTWETISPECIETPDQAFQSIIDEGYRVSYSRIPITDEQAPIPDVFDQFIARHQSVDQDTDVIFNCQMGRGRTTTGQVTSCLLQMTAQLDVEQLNSVESEPWTDAAQKSENEEVVRLQNGEYRMILQLVSVLSYGKSAKRLTDRAINMCDHMQNLRKAIYDLKLRLDAAEPGSTKWQIALHGATNYLARYFYLIVFANYLLERALDHQQQQNTDQLSVTDAAGLVSASVAGPTSDTFKQWLKSHREITNIIKYQAKDLS